MNRLRKYKVCCFLVLLVLSISRGTVFADYLEVETAFAVQRGIGKTSQLSLIQC